jgi:hypothetical protein
MNPPPAFPDPANYLLMDLPEVLPVDQPAIDPGLIADKYYSHALLLENPHGFQAIFVNAYLRRSLYVIRAIYVYHPVSVKKDDPVAFRLWRSKPR